MRRLNVLISLLALGITACGSTHQSNEALSLQPSTDVIVETSPEARTEPAPGDDDWIAYPTVVYLRGGMSSSELGNLMEQTVMRCMVNRGWEYRPLIQDATGPEYLLVQEILRFRGEYGYGMLRMPETDDSVFDDANWNGAYYQDLSPEEQDAYALDITGGDDNAPSEDSCRGLARAEIQIPLHDDHLVEEIGRAFDGYLASAAYRTAQAEWGICMQAKGFDVEVVDELLTQLEQIIVDQGDSDTVRAKEIEAATADFECALKTLIPAQRAHELRTIEEMTVRYPQYVLPGEIEGRPQDCELTKADLCQEHH